MTTFDEREKAFENKFEHDMELQFKARARSNKLLGLWAAGLLGKSGEAAEAYLAITRRAVASRSLTVSSYCTSRKRSGDISTIFETSFLPDATTRISTLPNRCLAASTIPSQSFSVEGRLLIGSTSAVAAMRGARRRKIPMSATVSRGVT